MNLITFVVLFTSLTGALSSTQTQNITQTQSQSFALPDLKVNKDTINCQNAQALLTAANNDTTRLTNFVKQDLPVSLTYVQDALKLVQQVCDASSQIKSLNLLQANTHTKSRSKLHSAIKSLAQQMIDPNKDSTGLYDLLIKDRLETASNLLIEVNSNTDSGGDGNTIQSTCNDIAARLQTLTSYLNFLSTQIPAQYLNTALPKRIQDINTAITQCKAIVTQTGFFENTFSGDMTVQQGYERSTYIPVTFPVPFDEVPSVGLAIVGFDITPQYPSVFTQAQSITKTGFSVFVVAPQNSLISYIKGSYIATISSKSKIYISTIQFLSGDPDIRQQIDSSSEYVFATRSITPAPIKNPKYIALYSLIIHYGYSPLMHLELNVDQNAATVQLAYVKKDVAPHWVYATIIGYEGNDPTNTPVNVGMTFGALSQGGGDRQQVAPNLGMNDRRTANSNYVPFFGLSRYIGDYSSGRFSLKPSFDPQSRDLTVWALQGTLIKVLAFQGLVTCQYADRSMCSS